MSIFSALCCRRKMAAPGDPVSAAPDAVALQAAVEKGDVESLVQLIEAGADVNGTNSNGDSALMVAELNGHVDCVGPLIEAGADVNMSNSEGNCRVSAH